VGGRQKTNGAENETKDVRDIGTGKKVWMATEKQRRGTQEGVANHWETRWCQRKRGNASVHIKAPPQRIDYNNGKVQP
jgi:hypothetical protein